MIYSTQTFLLENTDPGTMYLKAAVFVYVDLFRGAGKRTQPLRQAPFRGTLLKKSSLSLEHASSVYWCCQTVTHKFTFRQNAIVGLCSLAVAEHVIYPATNLSHSHRSHHQAPPLLCLCVSVRGHRSWHPSWTTEASLSPGARLPVQLRQLRYGNRPCAQPARRLEPERAADCGQDLAFRWEFHGG